MPWETCEVRDEVEKEEDEKVDGEHGEHGEHAAQASQGFELELRKDEAIPAVQICVRLRPMLQWERAEGYEPSGMEFKEGVDGSISLKEDGRQRHFGFNSVMGQESTQQESLGHGAHGRRGEQGGPRLQRHGLRLWPDRHGQDAHHGGLHLRAPLRLLRAHDASGTPSS